MRDDRHSSEQTNPSLLRRIQGGDNQTAWAEFDSLYRPMLQRFAKARGLSDADADDVVQHCMTAVFTHIDGFAYDPKRGRFKSWLRTLVNNRCRDLRRLPRATVADSERLQEMPATDDSPEDAFEKIWIDEHLNHCLRLIRTEVDDVTFTAFQRYVLNTEPAEVVCREMSLAPARLYKIKHRLTRTLRERMAALVGEELELPAES